MLDICVALRSVTRAVAVRHCVCVCAKDVVLARMFNRSRNQVAGWPKVLPGRPILCKPVHARAGFGFVQNSAGLDYSSGRRTGLN